jgi:CubicO group peptidase (beta-lactamase class C family)
MNKKTLFFLLGSFFVNLTYAQLPEVNGSSAAPDEWLLSQGQRWHYHTNSASKPKQLNFREPKADEKSVVEKAQQILASSSAKSIALVDGTDVVWVGYKTPANSSSHFLSFSMGKTITAMAVGKAICDGKFSLNSVTGDLVPELKGTDLGKATVKNLLMMSSGTWRGNKDSTIVTPEQSRQLLSGELNTLELLKTSQVNSFHSNVFGSDKPGEQFHYRSTDPLTLGVIINRKTGMDYVKWVEKEVLLPAGIKTYGIIGQDKSNYGIADGNVRLTMDDWIRFAVWVKENQLAQGCFGDYVRAASTTQISNNRANFGKLFGGYGYMTWTDNDKLRDSYWASGWGGQRIGWNQKNNRIVIAFSNVENYVDELYWLYKDWATLGPSK